MITPTHLLSAASVLLRGASTLDEYIGGLAPVADNNSGIGPATYGFLARVTNVRRDAYLSVIAKEAIAGAANRVRNAASPTLGKRTRVRKKKSPHPAPNLLTGFLPIDDASHHLGLETRAFVHMLKQLRAHAHCRHDGARSQHTVNLRTLIESFPGVFDSMGPYDTAQTLGIPIEGIYDLASAGHLEQTFESRLHHRDLARYSRTSIESLRRGLTEIDNEGIPGEFPSLEIALRKAGYMPSDSGLGIIYALHFPARMARLNRLDGPLKALAVRDYSHFKTALAELEHGVREYCPSITRGEVARILGVSGRTVTNLLRSGIIKSGTKSRTKKYYRSHILAAQERIVLAPEVIETLSLRCNTQVGPTMRALGLMPLLPAGNGFPVVFDRRAFSAALKK